MQTAIDIGRATHGYLLRHPPLLSAVIPVCEGRGAFIVCRLCSCRAASWGRPVGHRRAGHQPRTRLVRQQANAAIRHSRCWLAGLHQEVAESNSTADRCRWEQRDCAVLPPLPLGALTTVTSPSHQFNIVIQPFGFVPHDCLRDLRATRPHDDRRLLDLRTFGS